VYQLMDYATCFGARKDVGIFLHTHYVSTVGKRGDVDIPNSFDQF
jgi:hypothetical protein